MAEPKLPHWRILDLFPNSRDVRIAPAFRALNSAWAEAITYDIANISPDQVAEIVDAAARAIAGHARRQGSRSQQESHLAEAALHLAEPFDASSDSHTGGLVPVERWQGIAYETHRRIAEPLQATEIGVQVPQLDRYFATAHDALMRLPAFVELIEAVEASDTASSLQGKGLPGAIVSLGVAERLMAAHQKGLLMQLLPSRLVRPELAQSWFVRNQFDFLQNSDRPGTWNELFWGFELPSGRRVPGLKQTAVAMKEYADLFDSVAQMHNGALSDRNGNFPALAWRTCLEAFDHAYINGGLFEITAVMQSLTTGDVRPFEDLVAQPSHFFEKDEHRERIHVDWQTARRPSAAFTKQEAARYASIESSANFQSARLLEGSVFWDTKQNLFVRIGQGSKTTTRVGNQLRGESQQVTVPAISVASYAMSEDGLSADVTMPVERPDASGRRNLLADVVMRNITSGRWRPVGETPRECARLGFATSIRKWLDNEVGDAPAISVVGKEAPPVDMQDWAKRSVGELLQNPDDSYIFIGSTRDGESVTLNSREFRSERSDGRLHAVREAEVDERGKVKASRPKREAALDLWRQTTLGELEVIGRISDPSLNPFRVDISDAQSRSVLPIVEVIRGEFVYPIELATQESALAWGEEQIGRVYVIGKQALLVGRMRPTDSAPVFQRRVFDVVETDNGHELVARTARKATGEGEYKNGEWESNQLYRAARPKETKLLGQVDLGSEEAMYPVRISLEAGQLSGVEAGAEPPQLAVPEYLHLGRRRNQHTAEPHLD